ncbi:hypothetical protein AAFF_G00353410 [Aldrovandia affinis]|uniref:Inward rectifier potassium channel C-terminal domain-containing protein n=1 Tax=Aldrovandia affinis TaxID=143900 RepID=A0AAD7VZY6_9TELE|nr:hypothetical protein AAFF_G00353410 [Aldrovandia affinis]
MRLYPYCLLAPLIVCHVIDRDSPLYDLSAAELQCSDLEVIVILEAGGDHRHHHAGPHLLRGGGDPVGPPLRPSSPRRRGSTPWTTPSSATRRGWRRRGAAGELDEKPSILIQTLQKSELAPELAAQEELHAPRHSMRKGNSMRRGNSALVVPKVQFLAPEGAQSATTIT